MTLIFFEDLLRVRLIDLVDVLLVVVLLYQVYRLIKGTNAINIFLGIIAFYVVWKVVKALHMEMLGEIFDAFVGVGLVALIVVFQPEIRRFLLLLGTPGFISKRPKRFFFWTLRLAEPLKLDFEPVIRACQKMSNTRTGALIIFSHLNDLRQYVETGELIEAKISDQLLENIFFKNSPLHDGAVIISDNRIKAARCILPVSDSQNIPVHLGLRHRAAIGLTEQSDAVAVIVSEQTGTISACKAGVIKTGLEPAELRNYLEGEFAGGQ